ncbi:MAG: efflux RND transporter periplasmic adaptor subunit [Saprospiraceae bacterium]
MKSNINIFLIVFAISALILSAPSCKTKSDANAEVEHEEGDGHNHEAEGDHSGHDHGEGEHNDSEEQNKTVHLNLAQYKNAGIDTGWFEMKNLSDIINATGYTKLPPQNQADVTAVMGGIVKNIKVIEGQYVKQGQSLATIQSLEYNKIRLEKSKLNESLQSAQANKQFLDVEFIRQKELADENINAKKTFQKVSSELELETKKIANLKEQINIIDQMLVLGGTTKSPVLSVNAPISGYISEVYVKIGSNAETGNPMFTILDNSKMHVDLMIYEKDLYKVKVGQNVRFILTNQNNKEIKGKIKNVGKNFENDTKSVAVHTDILDKNHNLIPGMYVNALVEVGTDNVSTLPADAVIKAEGREFIFIMKKENMEGKHEADEITFARIEVKTGISQLGNVQVNLLQPIQKGDKIVTNGAFYLQSHLTKESGGGGHAH